jgi:catalase
LVDALGLVSGVHPGHRAAHAKGVLCAGTFVATPEAAPLSRAAHFGGATHRAHVRFSNGSADPAAHDGVRDGRGLAMKVYLADGSTTDVIGITLPCFFVRTPEDLIEFSQARRPDPQTGAPDMEKVGKFLADHPETVPAVTAAITMAPPASYAGLVYNSLHAFGFVAADGTVRHGRYHFVPEDGETSLSEEEAAGRDPNYLQADLAERFGAGPVRFRLDVELAEEGDSLTDPTEQWPTDRARVTIGKLELSALAFDRERDGDILVFDPTRVTEGIVLTEDPILLARSGAYRESVTRRTQGTPG